MACHVWEIHRYNISIIIWRIIQTWHAMSLHFGIQSRPTFVDGIIRVF
ncbi:MAG: hypothetical protein HDS16_07705 [Bacteroides sp.]|nr:hypothetical protein [Bacteroides sp.]